MGDIFMSTGQVCDGVPICSAMAHFIMIVVALSLFSLLRESKHPPSRKRGEEGQMLLCTLLCKGRVMCNVTSSWFAPSNGDDHNFCKTTNWNFVFCSDNAYDSDLSVKESQIDIGTHLGLYYVNTSRHMAPYIAVCFG
jgi:hypothetical protein